MAGRANPPLRPPGRIAVLKFGGTCMQSPESRALVAERIAARRAMGWGVVAVVSAMGRRGAPYATDTLLDLVQGECPAAADSELVTAYVCGELISAAFAAALLRARGIPSACLSGWQAGIVTAGAPCGADVVAVHPQGVFDSLARGEVPVVAGSQGAGAGGGLATLGRGGSDTTASVLGIALDARLIEVYTDTPGVMTADPRVVPGARTIRRLSYRACERLAELGAKVIHPAAVRAAAARPDIPLVVRGLGRVSDGGPGAHGGPRSQGDGSPSEPACGGFTLVGGAVDGAGAPAGLAVTRGALAKQDCEDVAGGGWFPDDAGPGLAARGRSAAAGGLRAARLAVVFEGRIRDGALARYPGAVAACGARPLWWSAEAGAVSVWVSEDQTERAAGALHRALFEEGGAAPREPGE